MFLDNAAHFTEEQRETILKNYFIDLTPKFDGSHLQVFWQHLVASFQYFPWYETDEKFKLASANLPPETLANLCQSAVADFMAVGTHYADAYRAAFQHEKAGYVQNLKVPTVIFKWTGSIILPYIEQLIQHPLPTNVVVETTPAPVLERYETMKKQIEKRY